MNLFIGLRSSFSCDRFSSTIWNFERKLIFFTFMNLTNIWIFPPKSRLSLYAPKLYSNCRLSKNLNYGVLARKFKKVWWYILWIFWNPVKNRRKNHFTHFWSRREILMMAKGKKPCGMKYVTEVIKNIKIASYSRQHEKGGSRISSNKQTYVHALVWNCSCVCYLETKVKSIESHFKSTNICQKESGNWLNAASLSSSSDWIFSE